MGCTVSWMNEKLSVRDSPTQGKGVFARSPILRGERLAIFGGRIMTIDAADSLPEVLATYTMQIEERFVLFGGDADAEDVDFFNHSCSPNAGFKGQIFLVAMRDITEGEEVTFDYAMVLSQGIGTEYYFSMDCLCGSPECRKKVTDDDWKDPAIRRRYRGFFSQYIVDRIAQGQ